MKKFALVFVFFAVVQVIAQGELRGVSAEVDMSGIAIQVEQTLHLNLPDSVQSIEVKAFEFPGTALSLISANSAGEILLLEELEKEGMKYVKLSTQTGRLSDILFTYEARIAEDQFNLPFFVTDFSAASSDNDFFKLNIRMKKSQAYSLRFPKVDMQEITGESYKEIQLEVPALPSFLGMELYTGEKEAVEISTIVDWLVALIFVGIGFLIWFNRNLLSYG